MKKSKLNIANTSKQDKGSTVKDFCNDFKEAVNELCDELIQVLIDTVDSKKNINSLTNHGGDHAWEKSKYKKARQLLKEKPLACKEKQDENLSSKLK